MLRLSRVFRQESSFTIRDKQAAQPCPHHDHAARTHSSLDGFKSCAGRSGADFNDARACHPPAVMQTADVNPAWPAVDTGCMERTSGPASTGSGCTDRARRTPPQRRGVRRLGDRHTESEKAGNTRVRTGLESELGRSSTFCSPCVCSDHSSRTASSKIRVRPRRWQRRRRCGVLLVEDNDTNRTILREQLVPGRPTRRAVHGGHSGSPHPRRGWF